MTLVFIYALTDMSGVCRYVGKSKNPRKRYGVHLSNLKRERTHKANWIRAMLAKGCRPGLEILDEVLEEEAAFWECEWIRFYRLWPQTLTNGTDGGEGATNPSLETRLRRGQALQGRVFSAEHRAKIGNALRGRPGRKKSSQEIESTTGKLLGRKHSDSKSGFAGVSEHFGKWRARVGLRGGTVYLGRFSKLEDAVFVRALYLLVYGKER